MCVRLASSAARARPKSVSSARSTPCSSRMFDGFTSRCTRPCAWAAARPAAVWRPIRRISRTVQRPLAVEPRLQRFAGDVLHDQERGGAVGLDVVNRHDVLVNDGRGRRASRAKSLPGRAAAGQVRGEHLDRHRAVQLGIKALEDDAHAAGADQPFDFVAAEAAEHFRVRRRSESCRAIASVQAAACAIAGSRSRR